MIVKVADELRRVAQTITAEQEAVEVERDAPKSIAKAIQLGLAEAKKKLEKGGVVTAAEVDAALVTAGMGPLTRAIALAVVMIITGLSQAGAQTADTTAVAGAIDKAADSLQTIRIDERGVLPGAMVISIAGVKSTITTKAQKAAFDVLNGLDKELGKQGVKQDKRQELLKPMMQGMGMAVK